MRSAQADGLQPDNALIIRTLRVHEFTPHDAAQSSARFVEVVSESGLSGWSGPIPTELVPIILQPLRASLIGQDALAYEASWQRMKRSDRHSRAGQFMMAISAVDIALWDLRGKHLNLPVYRLLGGPTRTSVPVYASLLGSSTEPSAARAVARDYFDRGFTAQKWFFEYGPEHGSVGFNHNVALVQSLREELGFDAALMFDCKWAWDVPYSVKFAKAIRAFAPAWLEEPIRSEHVDGYETIKRDGGIPIAGGEHLYSRWDVKPFLDRKALDYVQTDPEWCGGITELVKICALAEVYGIPVIPHGHHIWAALHVVASRPPQVCPMVEYLFNYMPHKLRFQTPQIVPLAGQIAVPTDPGLGFAIDQAQIAGQRELTA